MTAPSAAPATVTTVSDRELHIERIFNAPRAKVWRAYSEPELLARWWGRGNRVDIERFEFEVGGHWRFVEHAAGETHGFEGRFREIVPRERISQTFEWDGMPGHPSIDTASFEEIDGGRTRLVVTSLFFTADEMAGMMQSGMEEGMNQSYAALDRLLEQL